MTFDSAMDEVEIGDACEALGLSQSMTDLVFDAHRRSPSGPSLLRTVLEHGGTHRTYVEAKVEIIRRVRPEAA